MVGSTTSRVNIALLQLITARQMFDEHHFLLMFVQKFFETDGCDRGIDKRMPWIFDTGSNCAGLTTSDGRDTGCIEWWGSLALLSRDWNNVAPWQVGAASDPYCQNPVGIYYWLREGSIIECDDGYRLDNSQCTLKQCSCNNGVGASGTECLTHGDAKCTSCDDGYFLDNSLECTLKQCSCNNGVGANGTECLTHGDAKCTSCDDGYFLDNSQCTPNQCSCDNGVGASGRECPTHGGAKCTSCDSVITSMMEYVKQMSVYASMVGANGTECPTHGDAKCTSCDSGYHQNDGICEANVCVCEHGFGATGTQCPTHGDAKCTSCRDGYHAK